MKPGRTIVVGTDAGLYCRVQALAEPRLLFSSVNEHGEQLGTHELDLSRPRQLLECAATVWHARNDNLAASVSIAADADAVLSALLSVVQWLSSPVSPQGGKGGRVLGLCCRHRLQDGGGTHGGGPPH